MANEVFSQAGIPVATHKTEGPSTTVTFLGILIDTDQFQLRLPVEKLARLRSLVALWQRKRSCTRKELESLVGHLSHAATVIRPGRIFLRQLFSLLSIAAKPHYQIRLNATVHADLQWWACFLQDWNGSSLFHQPNPTTHVYSDASGSFGCGAFDTALGWFQLQWPSHWTTIDIAVKEFLPVVVAAATWGRHWGGCYIRFHSDNMAVVAVLNKRTAKDPLLIHYLRCLFFYAAFYKFHYSAAHIPGSLNIAADALSRNNLHLFSISAPQIPQSLLPRQVLDLLVQEMPDWTSAQWTEMFRLSLYRVSPPAR